MIFRFIVTLLIIIIVDIYSFQAFRTAFKNKKRTTWIYWGFHLLMYASLFVAITLREELQQFGIQTIMTLLISFSLPKLIIVPFMFGEDIVRGLRWLVKTVFNYPPASSEKAENAISRSTFLSQTSLVLAGIPFIGIVNGITRGKYNFQINRIKVPIKNLPDSFQGLTITQISDIHTGSFDYRNGVKHGIELINEQESDLIFFTGDLVNNYLDELKGFEDLYQELYAREGVYSVLGNHDYGDYGNYTDAEKKEHLKRMIETHHNFGWQLMMNENKILQRGQDKLAIVGVENYGGSRGFRKSGRLDLAYKGTEDVPTKLLLSHDPSHWDVQVRPEYPDIDLMLSGHTHGFQMGVEIPGVIKWSPSQYIYQQWAGLYQEANQYLYVNRGFGFIGFSGRLGISPEITVVELVKG